MLMWKSVRPAALDNREDELAVSAIEARQANPMFSIYTDGRFESPSICVLVPADGGERVMALLGDGWQLCEDADEYEWCVWSAPSPAPDKHPVRLIAPWDIKKPYSLRKSRVANDDSKLLPLFGDA